MATFGFGPEQDPAELAAAIEAMKAQMEEQFEQLGINPAGFINPLLAGLNNSNNNEALPKSIVRDIAKKFTQAQGSQPIGANDLAEVKVALDLAQLWLDEKTDFALRSSESLLAISRSDWVDGTLIGWQENVEPLAKGLASALSNLLAEASEEVSENMQQDIPVEMIGSMLKSFVGSLIATQLGQAIGELSATVTGTHDVGLPLLQPVSPSLIPQNISNWAADLDIPIAEVRLFHALREAAIARLFDNNPWLIENLRGAITDYGRGITIDMTAIQDQATNFMSSNDVDINNPETFTNAINQGLFTPEESEAQKLALTKLEVALALIDGWVDEVVGSAADERLPNLDKLRETLRRRRATNAPTKQLFSSLLGLEVSPRLAREAASFWRTISELRDIPTRDKIWAGIWPTQSELLDPQSYLSSIEVPDDLSGLF